MASIQVRPVIEQPVPTRSSQRSALRRVIHKPQFWLGFIVLVPTLIWYIVFQFGPVLESFWFSLVFVRLLHILDSHYVGLSNFTQLFDPVLNPNVVPALQSTVIWTILQFVIVLPLSLILAVCLTTITRGRTLFQIALFLPVITPLVVVGLIMGRFFDPAIGVANQVFHALGLPRLSWLHDPQLALPLAASIGAWRWLGLYTILLTAGMLNIPLDVRDAAQVDGANGWLVFQKITLPLLGNILVLVMILLLVNSVQEFTLPATLDSTTGYTPDPLVMVNAVLGNFVFGGNLQLGVGSAMAVLECLATLTISLLILKLFRPTWSD